MSDEEESYGKPVVPASSALGFWGYQTIFWGCGIGLAAALDKLGAEGIISNALGLRGNKTKIGISLGAIALLAQLPLIPAVKGLIDARKKYNVGHPIHHPAPNDVASDEERILFLCKLRAFENTNEALPLFLAKAYAVAFSEKPGTAIFATFMFAVGRIIYGIGYGSGQPTKRIPGIAISALFGDSLLNGVIIISLVRQIFGSK